MYDDIHEYLYIYRGENKAVDIYNTTRLLEKENIELKAEIATLQAQIRGGK